jgi:hypothetical protein
MSQVIIHKSPSEFGNVAVCSPTGELPINEVLNRVKAEYPDAFIVDASSLPNQHNDFFNAWELVDGKVEVSLSKATEITKNRLRMERTPLLAAQDVAFQRALESGASTTAIVAEKQRLRDITGLVDAVTTLDALRALKAGA